MKLRASSRLEEATLAKISPYFIEEIYERNIWIPFSFADITHFLF